MLESEAHLLMNNGCVLKERLENMSAFQYSHITKSVSREVAERPSAFC